VASVPFDSLSFASQLDFMGVTARNLSQIRKIDLRFKGNNLDRLRSIGGFRHTGQA